MEKGDPTFIPKKSTKRQHREEPPVTRSSRKGERFEEDRVEVISDSESITLSQQKALQQRLEKTTKWKRAVKKEAMETESQTLGKLFELLINKQAESEASLVQRQTESEEKNRQLIEHLAKDRPTMAMGIPSVDGTTTIDLTKGLHATYPKMAQNENMATYLAKLEYSFVMNKTLDLRKCPILWSHLTPEACDKLMATGPIPGESYDSLKTKLLSEYKVGYTTAAAEALKPINPEISIRETLKRRDEMLAIVAEKATTIPQALSCVSRMLVRSQLTESLVYELDAQAPENHHTFHRRCEEWRDRQIPGTSMIKSPKREPEKTNPHKSREHFKCCTCGKQGHTSKYCRSNKPVTESPERKPVVCYNCREIGHKAPACPKPKTEKPRKKEIKLLNEDKPKIKELQENEILVRVAGKDVPVTLDSGATITVLPKEIVPSTWLTGDKLLVKVLALTTMLI